MTRTETAGCVFKAAWELYRKYEAGPQQNADTYWYNLAADAQKLTDSYPCGLAEDLAHAVIRECDRREKKNDK